MEDDSQVSIGCAHSREGGISGPPRSLPPPPSFLQILPPWSVPTEAIHQGAEGNASSSDTSSPAAYCPSASCATALPIDQSRLLQRFLFPISFPFFFGQTTAPLPRLLFPEKSLKRQRPFARRRISGGHPNLCCSRCPRRGKPRPIWSSEQRGIIYGNHRSVHSNHESWEARWRSGAAMVFERSSSVRKSERTGRI